MKSLSREASLVDSDLYMSKITLTLPDSTKKEISSDSTIEQFIIENLPFLKSKALAARLDGALVDLSTPVVTDAKIEIITYDSKEGKEVFRHTSAHILGQAVQRLFKDAKLTIGPVVDNGPGFFYYDIDFLGTLTAEDLPLIEKEIEKIVKEDLRVSRREMSKKEAIEIFAKMGENYKVEIINDIPVEVVSIYGQGEWSDLCRGPHLPSTGMVKAFKLTAISGAYWKGDSNNRMLTRIYGVSFPTKKELEQYLFQLAEAKKRDHRKIGKEMDLFSFQEEAPGFPFWHPKGTILWNNLANYIRRECAIRGYQEVKTPFIMNSGLWKKSGHWDNFHENMYFTQIDDADYAVKPMNCPGGSLVYKHNVHSYRDLPLRYSELGMVHRHELHGVLHGLFRVRAFTQDDAHVFTAIEGLQKEVADIIDFTFSVYKKFGFTEFKTYIATRPEKSIGSDEDWDQSTNSLKDALTAKGIGYDTKDGEGAFYGPKIEFNITDSLGRLWQCGTIQVDFSMPGRFGLEYTDNENKKKQPVMIHRAIYGSLERFIGILIEHFEGKFPLWISPVQVKILTVVEKHNEYAEKINRALVSNGIWTDMDLRNEKIGYKIREAILEKFNFILIIGDKELESGEISYRRRGEESTQSISLANLLKILKEEIEDGK